MADTQLAIEQLRADLASLSEEVARLSFRTRELRATVRQDLVNLENAVQVLDERSSSAN